MNQTGRRSLAGGLAATLLLFGVVACDTVAGSPGPEAALTFEVDPFWPQPLEYPYILGSVNGVAVDSRDHVFIVHGGYETLIASTEAGALPRVFQGNELPPSGECCAPAPFVLEYDPSGTLVNQWGGEGAGYTWPAMPNGIAVDPEGNVWIGGQEDDSHLLKFSATGEFIAEFDDLGGPADFAFDTSADEVYVADGYANRRVAVLDMNTGEVKRAFGAYGNEPEGGEPADYDPAAEPSQQFGLPVSCVAFSSDSLLYVCDRMNNRIQIFQPDGTFVNEVIIAPETLAQGSVWDIAFSPDDNQSYLYVADGHNEKVHILDRQTLEVLSSFGRGGRYPGHFYGVHSVAADSEGNVYTGETYHGKRLQKFRNTGTDAPLGDQGATWPE